MKFSTMLTPKKMFIVDGPIAAGKSTLLENLKKLDPSLAVFPEPLQSWGKYYDRDLLAEFTNLASGATDRSNDDNPCFLFQLLVFKTFLARFGEMINNKASDVIIMERGFLSAASVFLPINKELFTPLEYGLLYELNTTAHFLLEGNISPIILSLTMEENKKRILERNRESEIRLPDSYLQKQHDFFASSTLDGPFRFPSDEPEQLATKVLEYIHKVVKEDPFGTTFEDRATKLKYRELGRKIAESLGKVEEKDESSVDMPEEKKDTDGKEEDIQASQQID